MVNMLVVALLLTIHQYFILTDVGVTNVEVNLTHTGGGGGEAAPSANTGNTYFCEFYGHKTFNFICVSGTF